jgi:inactive STAND/Effector-associated domain 9
MTNGDQSIFSVKQKYRELLLQQYAAAYDQLSSTIDKSEHPVINAKIQQLEDKIKIVEGEITALQNTSSNVDVRIKSKVYRESFDSWEDNLYRIDFSKTTTSLNKVCQEIEYKEGAALFLLKNSTSMGGKWCIKKIVKHLQSIGNWDPPVEFSFSSRPNINHIDFLYDIANKFDVKIDQDNEQQIINELIKKIYLALIGGGNIFMIQVDIPYLDAKSTFLDWFVNHFWCPLIQHIPLISQKSPLVKIFAVITVRGAVEKQCLPEILLCKKPPFAGDKILEIPLQKWTEQDICNWLINFSGLMLPAVGMTRSNIESMAKSIYQITRGQPIHVYGELMNTMTSKVS